MNIDERLYQTLEQHLPFNKARIKFICLFIVALLKVPTVNFVKIAVALNGKVQQKSNYRRIQRFMASYPLCSQYIGKIVMALIAPKGNVTIAIDRTEWQSGHRWINILMAAIVVDGVGFPITWFSLPGQQASGTAHRIELMRRILAVVPQESVGALVADREFIGHDWFRWLCKHNIPLYIRIKQNAVVASNGSLVPVYRLFEDLPVGQARRIGRQRSVYGNKLWITGMKFKDEYMIIASNVDNLLAMDYYKQRWAIETLFLNFKERCFNLEATHLRDPERISKLIGLLTLAYTWAYIVGDSLHIKKPLKTKKHGRLEMSIFRYGLDHLQMLLQHTTLPVFRKSLRQCCKLLKYRLLQGKISFPQAI